MADRRMFSKTIIDSDDFLNMPLSTQCLYFHLAMRADDEGFLNNPKKIQRMIGATEDDFRVLFSRQYVIPFESGIVVIRHWKIHNYIRGDRLKNTIFQEEADRLAIDKSGAYVLAETTEPAIADSSQPPADTLTVKCQSSDSQATVKCPSSGGIGKVRLGKIRLGEDRIKADWRANLEHLSDLFDLSNEVKAAFVKYLTYLEESGSRRKITALSAESILQKLETLADTDADAVAIFDQSIRNGWKDLYVLKKPEEKPKKSAVRSFGDYEQRKTNYSEIEKMMYAADDKGEGFDEERSVF